MPVIIRVRSSVGTWRIDVGSTASTLEDLKTKISSSYNIPVDSQVLCSDSDCVVPLFPNSLQLQELNVGHGDMLYLQGRLDKQVVKASYVNDNGDVVSAGTTLVQKTVEDDIGTTNVSGNSLSTEAVVSKPPAPEVINSNHISSGAPVATDTMPAGNGTQLRSEDEIVDSDAAFAAALDKEWNQSAAMSTPETAPDMPDSTYDHYDADGQYIRSPDKLKSMTLIDDFPSYSGSSYQYSDHRDSELREYMRKLEREDARNKQNSPHIRMGTTGTTGGLSIRSIRPSITQRGTHAAPSSSSGSDAASTKNVVFDMDNMWQQELIAREQDFLTAGINREPVQDLSNDTSTDTLITTAAILDAGWLPNSKKHDATQRDIVVDNVDRNEHEVDDVKDEDDLEEAIRLSLMPNDEVVDLTAVPCVPRGSATTSSTQPTTAGGSTSVSTSSTPRLSAPRRPVNTLGNAVPSTSTHNTPALAGRTGGLRPPKQSKNRTSVTVVSSTTSSTASTTRSNLDTVMMVTGKIVPSSSRKPIISTGGKSLLPSKGKSGTAGAGATSTPESVSLMDRNGEGEKRRGNVRTSSSPITLVDTSPSSASVSRLSPASGGVNRNNNAHKKPKYSNSTTMGRGEDSIKAAASGNATVQASPIRSHPVGDISPRQRAGRLVSDLTSTSSPTSSNRVPRPITKPIAVHFGADTIAARLRAPHTLAPSSHQLSISNVGTAVGNNRGGGNEARSSRSAGSKLLVGNSKIASGKVVSDTAAPSAQGNSDLGDGAAPVISMASTAHRPSNRPAVRRDIASTASRNRRIGLEANTAVAAPNRRTSDGRRSIINPTPVPSSTAARESDDIEAEMLALAIADSLKDT